MAATSVEKTFRIWRQNPDGETPPGFAVYRLACSPLEQVLSVLLRIRDEHDGSLAFRHSCGHAICGSCAMTIQKRSALACKTLIRDLPAATITIEPLRGFPVVRDLVVDLDGFFAGIERVEPYLQPAEGRVPADRERDQSPAEAESIAEPSRCILCAACTAACPNFWKHPDTLGPAALLKAWRFVVDSRDAADDRRLTAVDGEDGVWRCHQIYNCLDACPKDIDIPAELAKLKRAVLHRRKRRNRRL